MTPLLLTLLLAFCAPARSLQPPLRGTIAAVSTSTDTHASTVTDACHSRRSVLSAPVAATAAMVFSALPSAAKGTNGLPLTTAPSGLRWTDAKVGTGRSVGVGDQASIDYSMASTAGRFPQIYSTKDTGAPYRWRIGDGTTIAGIERAVVGDPNDGIPAMLPGGIRRVIVPANLGYQVLAKPYAKCIEGGKDGAVGPIPPKDGSGAYQRWYQFYCNSRIPYQPDLVLDIKLYGRR